MALAQRIPLLLADGRLEKSVGTTLSLADSGLMVCGNPELARDLRQFLTERGFATNRCGVPGQMPFEKYRGEGNAAAHWPAARVRQT